MLNTKKCNRKNLYSCTYTVFFFKRRQKSLAKVTKHQHAIIVITLQLDNCGFRFGNDFQFQQIMTSVYYTLQPFDFRKSTINTMTVILEQKLRADNSIIHTYVCLSAELPQNSIKSGENEKFTVCSTARVTDYT